MDKDKTAVEEFLGTLEGDKENKNPFQENPEDPFNEAKAEVKEEEVVEEKPLPFNKDPKVQKFIEKEISKRLADFKPESKQETKEENDEVVESLIAVIGNDTPEKRRAVEALRNRLDEGTRKIAEWESQQQQAEIADREAEVELENAFENIEETFDVDITSNNPLAKKLRQEFVSRIEKYAPKDRNGDIVDYPDMIPLFEDFLAEKKSTQQPNRAKDLASRSMARSSEAPSVKDTKGLNFDNIIEHITSQ